MNQNLLRIGMWLMLFTGACTGMHENYEPYITEGETIYTPRPLDVHVNPGRERVAIEWKMTGTGNVDNAVVLCGEKVIMATIEGLEDTLKTLVIPELEEGSYFFKVRTGNNQGDSSLWSDEITGTVYGSKYEAGLRNRKVLNMETTSEAVIIHWLSPAKSLLECILTFEDAEGNFHELVVPASQSQTSIDSYKTGGTVRYHSLYLPEPSAIDTFASTVGTFTFPE
ncbi:DUF4998 domain-containing protein [Rapidithrix thailandica]|uniref:DUF4998 domain-containing protein n=1 Tax=Rapidithrix thailandica TaxID=413964 RepID=A0AAW9S3D0_9BACT